MGGSVHPLPPPPFPSIPPARDTHPGVGFLTRFCKDIRRNQEITPRHGCRAPGFGFSSLVFSSRILFLFVFFFYFFYLFFSFFFFFFFFCKMHLPAKFFAGDIFSRFCCLNIRILKNQYGFDGKNRKPQPRLEAEN